MGHEAHTTRRPALFACMSFLWLAGGCQHTQVSSGPLIGITSDYGPATKDKSAQTSAPFNYAQAVADNGGIPVVLPTIDDERVLKVYIEKLDGLVLIGGDDIPPKVYGEEPHETVKPLTPERYEFERKLIARWLASGKPVLGVCLGMQFTNVVRGGTMIQDIPSEIGKMVDHRKYHRVRIDSGSSLARILGAEEASVLSSHHQAVDGLGRNLRVIARSEDGVAEALERTDGGFGLFVQWHPEAMTDLAHRDAIYGALVRACSTSKRSR
ncbi:MAG: gamma-glutamyl-gamma-aminobutyrate hydrolase family protein [Phycisphaerae bacterium]|nr:gamma-glutamyl-gamma-aminobutyrate hydrolase family protein [Phycisphaerae bacterium]